MEESKKKPLMLVIIVVCLVCAVAITMIFKGGKEDYYKGVTTWVKCKKCNVEYEMDFTIYNDSVSKLYNANNTNPALECEKCGAEAVYRAVKCPKCSAIFLYNSIPNKLADTCTECGFSQIQDDRDKRFSR